MLSFPRSSSCLSARFSPRLPIVARLLVAVALLALFTAPGVAASTSDPASGAKYAGPPVKYVFLFIGDGLGMPQRNAAEQYLAALRDQSKPGIVQLSFSRFPVQGVTTTYSSESLITDSAAAGTAMACGVKTYNAGIGVDPAKKPVASIAELAHAAGRKVGVVSSVSLDHATPASFYAHQPSRKDYYEIGLQLPKSGFDYFAGGGLLDPEGRKSKKEGEKPGVVDEIKKAGYRYVNDQDEFRALKPSVGKVVFVHPKLQDEEAMQYAIDAQPGDVTLRDLVTKGVEMLDNPKGFFLMVEGGKIDWACHANDAMAAIGDTLAFDEAVQEALKFQAKHPKETLVVVTGDHETGGMTLGFAGTRYESFMDRLKSQKGSYIEFDKKLAAFRKEKGASASFDDVQPLLAEFFGLKFASEAELAELSKGGAKDVGLTLLDFEDKALREAFARSMSGEKEKPSKKSAYDAEYLLYGGYEPLTVAVTHVLNQKSGIGWTTYSHTGVPILTSASGPGAELWGGFYDNADFFAKLASLMGVSRAVAQR